VIRVFTLDVMLLECHDTVKYLTTVHGKTFEIEIGQDGQVIVNGQPRTVDFARITDTLYSVIVNNESIEALVERRDAVYDLLMFGDLYEVEVKDERQQRLLNTAGGMAVGHGEITVKSPMPGLIVDVRVTEGQEVHKGQALVVLESMKMENELKAPRAGTVGRIFVKKGEGVEQNKPLITLS